MLKHRQIRASAFNAALSQQIVAKASKAKCILVSTESRSDYNSKPDTRDRCPLAITVLETNIHDVADCKGAEVFVEEYSRRENLRQNL
jgi:hypothetical protein